MLEDWDTDVAWLALAATAASEQGQSAIPGCATAPLRRWLLRSDFNFICVSIRCTLLYVVCVTAGVSANGGAAPGLLQTPAAARLRISSRGVPQVCGGLLVLELMLVRLDRRVVPALLQTCDDAPMAVCAEG